MIYNRTAIQQVEAVQLISKRVDGNKLITYWSSCPEWFVDKINTGDIYIYPYPNTIRISNFNIYEDDLFESNWVIKEENDEIYVLDDRYFLDHYKLNEEFAYEEYAEKIYMHEFDIK